MSYVKNSTYRDIPFCPDTNQNDFYIYQDLKEIPHQCEMLKDEIIKCRTIGILQSLNGRFYLNDFSSSGTDSKPLVQVALVYMQTELPSTVIPYPVQIFGTLQWKNRPVIFAKIIQVLNPPTAIRLKKALSGITSTHLAKSYSKYSDEDLVDLT